MGCCSSGSAAAPRGVEPVSKPPEQGGGTASQSSVSTSTPGGGADSLAKSGVFELDENGATSEPIRDASGEEGLAQAKAQEALRACRARLDVGDVPGAESALVTALRQLEAEGEVRAVHLARASAEYADLLAQVRVMEDAVKDSLGQDTGTGEWVFGGDVKVDFKALGVTLDEETRKVLVPCGSTFKIYYRHDGKKIEVKMNGVLATHPGAGLSSVGGVAAMYHETQLWNTWHPTVVGNGPIELWKRRRCVNLWQVPMKFLMIKDCELVQERKHFFEDQGVFLLSLDSSHLSSFWETFPPPAGYRKMPAQNKTRMVMVVQKNTTFFSASIAAEGESTIPRFLVKFLVTWFVPEAVRRMLKSGAAACKANGPHDPFTAADADGVYAAARRLVDRGVQIDETSSRTRYTPQDLPSADVVLGRETSLLSWEQAFACRYSAEEGAGLVSAPDACPAPAAARELLQPASQEEGPLREEKLDEPRLRSPDDDDDDDQLPADMSKLELDDGDGAKRAAGGCLFC